MMLITPGTAFFSLYTFSSLVQVTKLVFGPSFRVERRSPREKLFWQVDYTGSLEASPPFFLQSVTKEKFLLELIPEAYRPYSFPLAPFNSV